MRMTVQIRCEQVFELDANTQLISTIVHAENTATCNGKFANPVTDYCWSCVFPIKIAGVSLFNQGQEDKPSNTDVVCTCAAQVEPL